MFFVATTKSAFAGGSECIEIHASRVTRVTFRFGASGTTTTPAFAKLNACPTLPGAKLAPFCAVPLLPPRMSLALPSPVHQLTRFVGSGVHLQVPAEPDPYWARTSAGDKARLKIWTSSIKPLNGKLPLSARPIREPGPSAEPL